MRKTWSSRKHLRAAVRFSAARAREVAAERLLDDDARERAVRPCALMSPACAEVLR